MLKQLFSAGVLSRATVEPSPVNPAEWVLTVTRICGEAIAVTHAASASVTKHYVRQSAALMDAHRIGFREVLIRLPEEFGSEDGVRTGAKGKAKPT